MVTIVLSATDHTGSKKYKDSIIEVCNEQYPESHLFQRFNHKLNNLYTDDIDICKDEINCRNILRLDRGMSYKNKKLTNFYVFFNKHDPKKNPLLFALIFDIEGSELHNKYYKSSDFNSKFTHTQTVSITTLINYENENSVLNALKEENDKLTNLLTYNIGRKPGDPPSGNGNDKYNCGKITVTIDPSSPPNLQVSSGFKRYKHTPNSQGSKMACLIFDNDVLIGDDGNELPGIQYRSYDYIKVYFSDNVSEPLLLELNTNNSKPNTNEFYYHFRSDNSSFHWKKIDVGKRVFDIQFDSRIDIFSQFNGQVITRFQGLLNKLRSQFHKSIFFLSDNKVNYKDSDVKKVFNQHNKFKLINNSNYIIVNDQTNTYGKCLEKTSFTVYVHDFTTSFGEVGTEKVQLKFIIPGNKINYSLITLYKNERTSGQDVEILEYNLKDKILYVYFCGEDPRPLLVSYGTVAYRPKDLTYYNSNWFRVSNINNFICKDTSKNPQLVNTLSEVTGLLNPVYLHKDAEYTIHIFNGTYIKIKVDKTEFACYYKYEYTHLNQIYRLGNIEYSANRKTGTLKYTNSNDNSNLTYVATYYYNKDVAREFPLIVALGFKGEYKKSYYKLNQTTPNYHWTHDSNINEGNLLDELFNQNERFNGSKSPKKDECIPSDNTPEIAGGVSAAVILGGGGVAGGIAYYKYPGLVLSLINKIIPR